MKDFIEKLEKLYSSQEGLYINYNRKELTFQSLFIWMQKYLDELCITEFEFKIIHNKVKILKYVHEDYIGFGHHIFPYEIILKDENKEFTPDNIKEVKLILK